MSRFRLHRVFLLFATALGVGSCGDGVSPELRGATVRISMAGTTYEEQTIAVGQTIQLSAAVIDAAGDQLPDESVEWRSSAPEVASVDLDGTVSGVAVGTAYIIAKHDVGEDSARVNVAAPVNGALQCAAGGEINLAIGETRIFDGPDATALCLPGSGSGSEYAITLANTGTTANARLQTRVEANGISTVGGGPVPNLVPRTTSDFHYRLRHDVSLRLEGRLRAGIDASSLPTVRRLMDVGDVVSFNVETLSSNGCDANAIDSRGARVRAVSTHAIVVADTLNPPGGFTDADYQQFAAFFDEEAWPLVTGTFGTPSDIDSNGKVIVLFTRAVNERPENVAGSGLRVGGFFYNRDLFPTSGASACAGSNAAEMFYMLVPDPTGAVRVDTPSGPMPAQKFGRELALKTTRSVLVHEFQHLVNDSRRLHITKSPVWEDTWLNEGLSHITEELMFYRSSGLQPGSNLGPSAFANESARSAFDLFQLDNVERFASYLRSPPTNSMLGNDVLATRGAAWHFLRYVADRHGNEAELWRKLVTDSKTAGIDNLRQALGQEPAPWIRDWSVAVYLDDTGLGAEAQYSEPSWNLRALYPAITTYWPPSHYELYPLNVTRLGSQTASNISIMGGSAAYLRAGVATGGTGAVRVTVGDLPAPTRLKVAVTRVR